MPVYHDIYWGYEITHPDFWIHKSIGDSEFFTATLNCLDPFYEEPDAGLIAIRGEWNWAKKDIRPLWNETIGKTAGFLGAKNIGAAPWKLGDAVGLEAEIVLPKKDIRRLWTGILSHEFCVLHLMVSHPKTVRTTFEPLATSVISSLKFSVPVFKFDITPEGIPIPPGYQRIDPKTVVDDIDDTAGWHAYDGETGIGALQSFYLREFPRHSWTISEYVPFTPLSNLGFARYRLAKDSIELTLGLMPAKSDDVESSQNHTRIVYKVSTT
ncbi:MAG: hypothetical protein GYA15_04315 [Leptolinea sp.]|jgi:hypothetical protein|nr:hypothetical protein [Leptolinea sp.]